MCIVGLVKDIDFAEFPVIQCGQMMHTIATKAVCFGQVLKPEFAQYAHQVVENCQVLAVGLSEAGVRLVWGGTDNLLLLLDVTPLGLTGR